MDIYVVVFSNCEPAEVAEIYSNKESADEHAEKFGGQWHVEQWTVKDRCELP